MSTQPQSYQRIFVSKTCQQSIAIVQSHANGLDIAGVIAPNVYIFNIFLIVGCGPVIMNILLMEVKKISKLQLTPRVDNCPSI